MKQKTQEMGDNEVIVHGEAMIYKAKLPKNVTPMAKTPYVIIAESEVVGNHHVVNWDLDGGHQFYKDDDTGDTYLVAEKPTVVRCLHKERHNEIVIPAGTYTFGTQMEYDPFKARLEKVRD